MQNNAVVACRKAGDIDKENKNGGKGRRSKAPKRCYEVTFAGDITVMLTEEEVLEFGLYSVGETSEPLNVILEKIIYARIRDNILNFVLFQLRTEKQVRERALADRTANGAEDVWEIFYVDALNRLISYLKEQAYINDDLYAKGYIKVRSERNVSASVIKYELRERGVSEDIIVKYLDDDPKSDYDRAYAVLVKRMKGKSPEGTRLDEKERLSACRFLSGKGFSPDAVLKAVKRYEEDED